MQKYTLVNAALHKGSEPLIKIIVIMKLVVMLVLISTFGVSASSYSQTLTMYKKSIDLPGFFKLVNEQTGYAFIFNKAILSNSAPIDLNVKNTPMEMVLKDVLEKSGLKYEIKYKTIIITPNGKNLPLNNTSSGTEKKHTSGETAGFSNQKITCYVTDERGLVLPGATITVIGKSKTKLTTDANGILAFSVSSTDESLQVSYIGFKTKTIKLENGKSRYYIILESENSSLNNVVVTGIFNKPKESYTGAVTVITKEQIKMFGNRNLLKTIGNIDPSFDIQERNNFGSDPNVKPQVEIRGSTTIADITQLGSTGIRADANVPLFILDGFEISLTRVMDMNQSDVESVVILKDASATSIYGSRGSNGVVVITSVKPVPGKLRVTYSAGINMEFPDLSSYNLMNSREKLDLEVKAGLYTSTNIPRQIQLTDLYNQNLKAVLEGVNTNWAKMPTQTGVGQYHKLDLSGGDDQFRYVLNGSYNQLSGAMKGTDRNNFNGSMTIIYTINKLRFSNNLGIGLNNSSSGNFGQYSEWVLLNPYFSPYDKDGKPIKTYTGFRAEYPIPSPFYNSTLTDFNKAHYTNIRNTTDMTWDISNSLHWSNALGFTKQEGGSDAFTSPSNTSFLVFTDATSKGSYYQSINSEQNYQVSSTLSFNKTLGKSSVFFGLNAQIFESQRDQTSVGVKGFINDTQTDISDGTSYIDAKPKRTENTVRTLGTTASANYIYEGKYFADASYRLDGASSFGRDSRFGNFWSAGFGWTASNEKFIKNNLSFVNQLRFRYSYGVTGSLNFSPADALTTYKYDPVQLYSYQNGATITGFGNEDLKWQNTRQQNFGVDISLFNNFSLSANSYIRNTDNAITIGTLSYSHGFDSYKENIGKIRNSGMDITASVYLLRNYGTKNINWSISAGTYTNTNVLVKLSDAFKKAMALQSSSVSNNLTPIYQEGQSMDEVYVFISPGVDPATGTVLYKSADGTISTTANEILKVPVGSSQPKLNGRLSSMVRYGSFTANIGFAFRNGGKKLNTTLIGKVENAFPTLNVDRRVADLRWQKPGDVTGFKSLSSDVATLPNTRFVFTENTVTINNINLQYDLPLKWIKKLNMQRLSISATMSDVYYLSNIEQERGTDYPYSLKPSFLLSATF